jgi:hypothetical protein
MGKGKQDGERTRATVGVQAGQGDLTILLVSRGDIVTDVLP